MSLRTACLSVGFRSHFVLIGFARSLNNDLLSSGHARVFIKDLERLRPRAILGWSFRSHPHHLCHCHLLYLLSDIICSGEQLSVRKSVKLPVQSKWSSSWLCCLDLGGLGCRLVLVWLMYCPDCFTVASGSVSFCARRLLHLSPFNPFPPPANYHWGVKSLHCSTVLFVKNEKDGKRKTNRKALQPVNRYK